MYHQDWLIRQIEIITRCVFTVLLGREDELSSEIHLETQRESPADANTLSFRLARLVRERRLCEAENLL